MADYQWTTKSNYEYARHRRKLEDCLAAGLGFGAAIAALDSLGLDEDRGVEKMKRIGYRKYYDVDLVKMPHFGGYHEIPLELAIASNRMILMWILRQFLTFDTPAVVEIGCGAGDLIVSLARDTQSRTTKFIGTEISNDALACVDILSGLAQTSVETRIFDVTKPSFDFLPSGGDTLVIVNAVLSYFDKDTIVKFLTALLRAPGNFNLCIFEILSIQLKNIFPDHTPLGVIEGWGQNISLLSAIDDMAGQLTVKRLLPDLSGKGAAYPLSVIHMVRHQS